MRKEYETLIGIAATAAALELSRFAFSKKTRDAIHKRARDKHGIAVSELSGRWDMPVECAHWDHSRKNPLYDDASNGRLLTVDEHLIDHIVREGSNGLTISENRWAIETLSSRVVQVAGKKYLQHVLKQAERWREVV